jgi:hypothetical protein
MKHTCHTPGRQGRTPGIVCIACREDNQRHRTEWMEAGLCDRCGKNKPEDGKVTCSYCLWRNQVAHLPLRARQSARQAIENFKGACECCGQKFTGNERRWNLDHNRVTEEFRGILCFNCNAALGISKEDINRLKAMINYIRKHS